MTTRDLIGLAEQHQVLTTVIAVSAALSLFLAYLAIRGLCRAIGRYRKRVGDDRVFTIIGASIAAGVSAQGMWVFFTDNVDTGVVLRVLMFAFIEVQVLGCAIRERKAKMADPNLIMGADGIAMWALTCATAILSATDASGIGAVLLRLITPFIAAWGWERGVAQERLEKKRRERKDRPDRRINWRLTPERVLIRLGLADPTDRTAGEVDAHRRLLRLAIATKRARSAGRGRRKWALRRLGRAMEGAVEHGGLGSNPDSADTLLAVLGTLINASDLLDLQTPAPWHQQAPIPDTPSVVSVPSGHPALEAPGDAPAVVDLGHAERALSVVSGAGQPKVQGLDWAIWVAKASGMSVRDIAAAYEITKYRVEKALSSDSRTATADTALEASGIRSADTGRSAGSSGVEAPDADSGRHFSDGGLRFAVELRHAEETARHTDNGQAPASVAGDLS